MDQLIFITAQTVNLFLSTLMILILVRVIWTWVGSEESRIYLFCCGVTEPFVHPVRVLLSRISFFEDSPIDFSYIATSLIIMLVQFALPLS